MTFIKSLYKALEVTSTAIFNFVEVVLVPLFGLLVAAFAMEVAVKNYGLSADIIPVVLAIGIYGYLYNLIAKSADFIFFMKKLLA